MKAFNVGIAPLSIDTESPVQYSHPLENNPNAGKIVLHKNSSNSILETIKISNNKGVIKLNHDICIQNSIIKLTTFMNSSFFNGECMCYVRKLNTYHM